jgi:hypothetical protein
MSNNDSSNSQGSASTPILSRESIISLLGSFQRRLRDLEKIQKSKQSSNTLIATIITAQVVGFAILSTVVYQNQRKISNLKTERSIPEIFVQNN